MLTAKQAGLIYDLVIASFSYVLPSFAWSILCGVLLTVGDFVFRSWLEHQSGAGFWVTLVIYIAGLLCMMLSCFSENIAIAAILAVVINSVGYLAIAWLWWGDTINSREAIGVLVGIAAIAILESRP